MDFAGITNTYSPRNAFEMADFPTESSGSESNNEAELQDQATISPRRATPALPVEHNETEGRSGGYEESVSWNFPINCISLESTRHAR